MPGKLKRSCLRTALWLTAGSVRRLERTAVRLRALHTQLFTCLHARKPTYTLPPGSIYNATPCCVRPGDTLEVLTIVPRPEDVYPAAARAADDEEWVKMSAARALRELRERGDALEARSHEQLKAVIAAEGDRP